MTMVSAEIQARESELNAWLAALRGLSSLNQVENGCCTGGLVVSNAVFGLQ